jgi:hypothetical protein
VVALHVPLLGLPGGLLQLLYLLLSVLQLLVLPLLLLRPRVEGGLEEEERDNQKADG